MERVVTYVDGYNLYFGLREKRWKQFYWLNIQSLAAHLLNADQTLVATHYFTTVVQRPEAKRRRQATYLEALGMLANFDIHYGQFLAETVICRTCGASYETYHEKMTDVNIAVALMSDVYQDRFDTAMLISADSDLVGPVRAACSLYPTKRVVVAFPPLRSSKALMKAASAYTYIGRDTLAKSVFPDELTKPDGYVLHRPAEW
jgi:uncharacterized LabA/DUF88 family protein